MGCIIGSGFMVSISVQRMCGFVLLPAIILEGSGDTSVFMHELLR